MTKPLLPSALSGSKSLEGGTLDCDELALRVDRLDEVLVGANVVAPERPAQRESKIALFLELGNQFVLLYRSLPFPGMSKLIGFKTLFFAFSWIEEIN